MEGRIRIEREGGWWREVGVEVGEGWGGGRWGGGAA